MRNPRPVSIANAVASAAILLLSGACGQTPPPPPDIPSPDEISLVTEALIIESILQDFSGQDRDRRATAYYDQLYDKYGIDGTDLGDLRTRFSNHPQLWIAAADSAAERVGRYRGDAVGLLTSTSFGDNMQTDTLPQH